MAEGMEDSDRPTGKDGGEREKEAAEKGRGNKAYVWLLLR